MWQQIFADDLLPYDQVLAVVFGVIKEDEVLLPNGMLAETANKWAKQLCEDIEEV